MLLPFIFLSLGLSGVAPGFLGWSTNGAAVFQVFTNPPPSGWFTNAQGLARRRPVSKLLPTTKKEFDHFLPGSLNNLIWTNFIAHTNGRSLRIWSVRQRPPGWPRVPPVVRWDIHGLMWGMRGLTALSPSWEGEGNPGQVPITALTRRHGYTRGHGMGLDGFNTRLAGERVWFLSADNTLVMRRILRSVVRTRGPGAGSADYTILLFDQDLPDTIQPMRVAHSDEVLAKYPQYEYYPGSPCPMFLTEQGGNVSAGVPGWTINAWKGGDSGSPNLLPMPGELVFLGGRSTSGASAQMQADMDQLSRSAGLNPAKYQMEWIDLSRFPELRADKNHEIRGKEKN